MFGYIHIRRRLIELLATHPISKMAIIRCPSKKEVDGLKMADLAAYSLPQFIATAPNPVAILKQIKLQFAGHSHHTPPKNMLDRLMGVSNPEETYRAVMKLTRGDAMAVTQILSGRYFPNHPSLQLNPQPKTNINIAI